MKYKFEVIRDDDYGVMGYHLGDWYLMKIYGWGDIVNWFILDRPKNHLFTCEQDKMGYVGDGYEQGWVRSCQEGKQILTERYEAKLNGEDVQACTAIKGFTSAHIDNPDDEEESGWYDWWNDVDGYLLGYDDKFKKIIYDFRDKYGMPKNISDDLCDKLADVIFDYVKNNLERLDIDPNENTDQDYAEFARERMVEWLIDPDLYYDFWDDYEGNSGVKGCGDIKCATEPNTPDAKKSKLVREIIKRAKEIRDYFQYHNNNLNRRQEQILDDLSDGIDSESIYAIRSAIENLKYNSKNMRSGQYELVIDLYDDFNLANGKYQGMGYPEADDDIEGCDDITGSTKSKYMATMVNASDDGGGFEQLVDYSEDDSTWEEPKYEAFSYYGTNYSGLEDNFVTDDPSDLMDWIWEHASKGGYIEVCGPKGCIRLDPDVLEENVDAGDIGEYEIMSQIDYL